LADSSAPGALRVLDLFASRQSLLLYPDEVASALGMHKTACYRLLDQMAAAGFLQRSEGSRLKAYRPGPKLIAVAARTAQSCAFEGEQAARTIYGASRVIAELAQRFGPPAAEPADLRLVAEGGRTGGTALRAVSEPEGGTALRAVSSEKGGAA